MEEGLQALLERSALADCWRGVRDGFAVVGRVRKHVAILTIVSREIESQKVRDDLPTSRSSRSMSSGSSPWCSYVDLKLRIARDLPQA